MVLYVFSYLVDTLLITGVFVLFFLIIGPRLLEAWLVLTSVKYHGNLYILIPLNQWLALTRLRATGPGTFSLNVFEKQQVGACLGPKAAIKSLPRAF